LSIVDSCHPYKSYATDSWHNKLTQPTKVKLQLKWAHQFQFAGYYMAQSKGFYKQQGIEVDLIPATPGIDPIKQVLNGNAQFGVGTSELLLHYHAGAPIVVLGVIFQHSPLGLVTLEASGIDNATDLQHRTVMIEENSSEIYAYLKQSNIDSNELNLLPHNFNINDLINGKVDAMTVYTTSEIFELSAKKIPYRIFTPRMGGIDFYGDNFFTTENYLQNNPELVEGFYRATAEGWKYAMSHIDETIEYIKETYPVSKSVSALKFEAEAMHALMRTDLIEPGHMSKKRWQHIASVYQELGLIDNIKPLNPFIYQYKSVVTRLETKIHDLILIISAAAALILMILFIARRFYRIKVQLTTMVNQSPMAIILLNEKFEVVEWNKQAEQTFGWSYKEVIKRNVFDFLVLEAQSPHVLKTLSKTLDTEKTSHSENKNNHKDGREITCNWSNALFHIDGEKYLLCMAIDNSEFRDLKALSLKKTQTYPGAQKDSNHAFLQQLVDIMQLSLHIWEECTSKTKLQLAEESQLWRVSLDGSTAKTRTFDKYLSIQSIPKKPRWKNVINTANFILRNYPEHPDAAKLQSLKSNIQPPNV